MLDQRRLAEGEGLRSNILSQDFARLLTATVNATPVGELITGAVEDRASGGLA